MSHTPACLPESMRTKLRKYVAENGEQAAIERLRVSRQALTRALAGLGIREGTRSLIESGLSEARAA